MTKLTDLEICKRMAEIEGIKYFTEATGNIEMVIFTDKDGLPYNPITDDALCFKLMVKYRVSTCFVRPAGSYISSGPDFNFKGNPNKAICLAIIETHK